MRHQRAENARRLEYEAARSDLRAARAEVAEVFVPGDHGSTFGGQPFATAAARAVLAELEAIDAPSAARNTKKGKRASRMRNESSAARPLTSWSP